MTLLLLAPTLSIWSGPAAWAADAATCRTEAEPNDKPAEAPVLVGAVCQSGTLTANDQDLILWEVLPAAALFGWTFRVDGVPRTITSIHVLPVTSAPGAESVTVGQETLRVDSSAETREPGVATDVVLAPGRYVLGVSKGTNIGPALESLGYEVRIEPTVADLPNGDVEPNDTVDQASPLEGAFGVVADLQGSPDVFRWTIGDADAGRTFDLDARALGGSPFTLTFAGDGGRPLASVGLGPDQRAHLYDLRLEAGTYQVTLAPASSEPRPYVLSAAFTSDPNADPEPNDTTELAAPVAVGTTVHGRLASVGDTDAYRLAIDPGPGATQLDIVLDSAPGLGREVCVYDASGVLVQCRQGQGGRVRLSNLLLAAGDHTVKVSGSDRPADGYTLRVDATGPVTAGREVEPNDVPARAAPLDVLEPLVGRADGIDDDLYRARVTGPPQLWRVDVTGDGVEALDWIREDAVVLGSGGLAPEGGRLVLRDLWLMPGHHWLRVRARDTDYMITFTPLGQPPLDSEIEPNGASAFAGSLSPEEQRVGRLTDPPDVDVYRFSLAAEEHVAIVLEPPPDGAASISLESSGVHLLDVDAGAPGEPVRHEGQLPAGDYEVWLRPVKASEDRYTLILQRDDPFTDGVTAVDELAATLELATAVGAVAGWWTDGQRVEGELTITSSSSAEQQFTLAARTSDDAWSVQLSEDVVSIPAGTSITVPLVIHVPADAWADVPVRITLGARDSSGAQASAFATIVPGAEVLPVAPEQAWTLPDELLGGLDVAATALGGRPVPGPDPAREALLFDDYAVPGFGWQAALAGAPATVTVDLAGDAPIPVAGFILDSLALDPGLASRPRDIEVLLSADGVEYQLVRAVELSPVMREQAFVLDEPVPARFAKLRIVSSWSGAGGTVALGEWKVIAQPGSVPDAGLVNLADPIVGGHVVAMAPLTNDDATMRGMLTDDPVPWLPNPADATSVRWTIGFRDDRTAVVTELQWVDPPGVDPSTLLAAVEVEASTSTVLGPWSPLATWVLERSADGSVAPLALPPGTWARFLRFTTAGPTAPSVVWAMPATLRAFERPTDDSYRSILGEWGRWEPRAIRERLEPMLVEPSPMEVGDDDLSTAQPLGMGQVVTGRVSRGRDVDWYTLTMPPDHDRLSLTLRGEPFVATEVKLYDALGAPVELEVDQQEGVAAFWTAATEPGATYNVVVEQLPVSTVFTYDSSGSMVRYLPFVADALRTFARGIVPGLDAVLIIPFEDAPLLDDWSDDPVALQQAVAAETAPSGSSAAELAMLDALARLGRRTGTRALVVLTDAETNSRTLAPDVLAELERLRPLVFAVHMGDLEDPALTTHLMQDWAATSEGTYQLTVSHREIDRTFARIAAWLRRPAAYSLSYQTSLIDRRPGTLSVAPAEGAAVPIGGGVSLELVLDTSGSMNKRIAGVTRMAMAQSVLTRLVDETLPEGLPVALRTFKAGRGSCKTVMAVPFGPLERAAMDRVIADLRIDRETRTPLGATLHAVGDDLASHEGPKIVVFVTDGKETCKGDPAAEVERLVDLGVDVALNIVGFALEDPALKADMASWAAAGGGVFFDAQDQEGLLAGIAGTLRAPFRVYDRDGLLVGSGVVGGTPVPLPAGTYRVEVLTEPPATFEAVTLPPGEGVELTIGEGATG